MTSPIAKAIELVNAGQRDEARKICEQLRQTDTNNPDVEHLWGVIAAQENRPDIAIESFERALQAREVWPEALCNLAAVFRSVGKFEESKDRLHRALHHDPRYARAFFFLSQIDSYRDQQLLDQIRTVLDHPPIAVEDQCMLHFSAGKICDDLGRFDESFFHYDLGNVARRAKFDPLDHRQLINRLIQTVDQNHTSKRAPYGSSSQRPIFVIGMPRSGTSLLEQILASHPDVYGAGELPDIPSISKTLPNYASNQQAYPECLTLLEDRVFEGFANAYLGRLDLLTPEGSARAVDKNPGNFMHVGLIAAMFPKASIVHCVRSPLSTCLSCYFQNFASHHDYAFNQTHLGFYYAQYERLMKHWRNVLPQRILEFSYERLIAEPEPVTRELLQWCNLEWDDRCLAPHETRRPVTTASAWEVRQPMYRSSLERWRNYEPYLGPLRNAIEQR